jgi:hypothetical protein
MRPPRSLSYLIFVAFVLIECASGANAASDNSKFGSTRNRSSTDVRTALAASTSDSQASVVPSEVDGCPGCCSSHGGITQSCAANGHVYCADGTVSPSCLCSTCGVSTPPPPPDCTGGQYWNGAMCVCPSGQILIGGVCTTPRTCAGGQVWNGFACECPTGEDFIFGQCTSGSAFVIGPGITGNWYNPNQSGHGFSIEVLPGNTLLAEWYVFEPQQPSAPTWIVGTGPITGNQAIVQGLQTVGPGGLFPPNFNPAQVNRQIPWGTLIFTFSDCDTGHLHWMSTATGYPASGDLDLVRLTLPAGLSCP